MTLDCHRILKYHFGTTVDLQEPLFKNNWKATVTRNPLLEGVGSWMGDLGAETTTFRSDSNEPSKNFIK